MADNAPQSREELLRELEEATGQTFRSREDIRNFVAAASGQKEAKRVRSERRWIIAKHATLAVFLALAVVQYYSFDVLLQILSIRGVTVFVPVSNPNLRSGLQGASLSI